MIAFLDKAERLILAIVARLGPWLATIGPAYAVARATMLILKWPEPIAWAVGVSVEAVGIAAAAATLRAYGWNRDKRKSDPPAPTGLGLACMAVYLCVGILLSVMVEVFPMLIAWSPAALFVLAGVGYAVLAMDGDQVRREAVVASDRAQAKQDRAQARQDKAAAQPVIVSAAPSFVPRWPDKVAFLSDTDRTDVRTASDIVRLAGVTERTARRWLAAAKNGSGIHEG